MDKQGNYLGALPSKHFLREILMKLPDILLRCLFLCYTTSGRRFYGFSHSWIICYILFIFSLKRVGRLFLKILCIDHLCLMSSHGFVPLCMIINACLLPPADTLWWILFSGQPCGEPAGITEAIGGGFWRAQDNTEQKQQPADHFRQGPAGQQHTFRSEAGETWSLNNIMIGLNLTYFKCIIWHKSLYHI